jgi:hypothetical protein
MANKNLKKPIVELDRPNGKPVAFWDSSKAAAEFYQMTPVSISYNINGKTKQAKGHYFRYATKKEIESYVQGMAKIEAAISAKNAETAQALEQNLIALPVETIPESVQKPDTHADTLSPFDRLLQGCKKKFNDNSE